MKNNRFEEMSLIQQEIKPELDKMGTFCPNIHKEVYTLLRQKLEKISVRATFTRKIYEYVKVEMGSKYPIENEELFLKQLPFISEVVIIIQYFHNQVFDEKVGTNTNRKISNKVIYADIFKDLLYDYIDNEVVEKHRYTVHKYIRKMFRFCDVGQYLDKNFCTYEAYKKGNFGGIKSINPEVDGFVDLKIVEDIINEVKNFAPNKTDFIDLYFRRISLTSAALFILSAELVMDLMDYKDEEGKNNISNFAKCYGLMLQIVNDNSDFVLRKENLFGKNKSDICSDLKNKNITLPLIYHLEKCNKENSIIYSFLENNNSNIDENLGRFIFKELVNNDSILKSIAIGKKINDVAKKCLSKNNAHYITLVSFLELGESHYKANKFYYEFYTKKNQIVSYKKRELFKIY